MTLKELQSGKTQKACTNCVCAPGSKFEKNGRNFIMHVNKKKLTLNMLSQFFL